jgi:hypothetical protein
VWFQKGIFRTVATFPGRLCMRNQEFLVSNAIRKKYSNTTEMCSIQFSKLKQAEKNIFLLLHSDRSQVIPISPQETVLQGLCI